MYFQKPMAMIVRTIACFLLISFLVLAISCGNNGVKGFHVSNITFKAPTWVPEYEYTFKYVVTVSFNRAVDKTTFKAPGTFNIDLKGMKYGKTASKIAGTFKFSKDLMTVVFISDKTGSELIDPQAGENVQYTITLIGNNVGSGVIADSSGEALDGDVDGKPGGDYKAVREVVG